MMNFKEISKCQNNPSVEFPKFIKQRLGTDRNFKILKFIYRNGSTRLFVSTDPAEYTIKKSGAIKTKDSGITGIWFNSATLVGYKKTVCFWLVGQEVRAIKDVSSDFLENYLKNGKCSYDNDHHELIEVSPKIKKCKHCNSKFKKRIKTLKKESWIKV